MSQAKARVLMLVTGDMVIGNSEMVDENNVSVEFPYSVYDMGKGPAVMPYMIPLLMEPMDQITLRLFDVMWSKSLDEFPMVKEQYNKATRKSPEIVTEEHKKIII